MKKYRRREEPLVASPSGSASWIEDRDDPHNDLMRDVDALDAALGATMARSFRDLSRNSQIDFQTDDMQFITSILNRASQYRMEFE